MTPVDAATFGFDTSQLQILLHWVRERESIRKAKEAGLPKPWTQDPVLQCWRFCNVSRRDDLVTRQLYQQFYRDDTPANQLVAATLARLINWPDALLDMTGGQPFQIEHLDTASDRLQARAARGSKVFTGAYIVPGITGMSKIESTLLTVERVRQSANSIFAATKRETWTNLMQVDLLGSFLAGQIVCDLADIQSGAQWPDRATFAPVGPGSARGINYMKGRPRDAAVSQAQFDRELEELITVIRPKIPEIFADRQLTASDLQNVLCETSKVLALRHGGHMKARYDGAAVPQAGLF